MSYHQTIYNLLRQAGMTEAGALGVIGNFECESNCEPFRKQGDYSSLRTISKEFTEKLNNGTFGKAQLTTGTFGYGLAQWTYPPRCRELYDFWKSYGGRIDDVTMQVEFALTEFKRDFIADWRLLCMTSDIYEAAKAVCYRFENPAVKNVEARYQAALRIKGEINLGEWEKSEVVIPPTEATKPTEYWSPRVLCKGMIGKDVVALRGLLYARDYIGTVDNDEFDEGLEEAVKLFQRAAFPSQPREWDGIVGDKTWTKLLER